ncbi:MAG: endonuclease III, partial [Bacteroidales bacterium]|nr:endonuclease III [Bacteroidales bacterium]
MTLRQRYDEFIAWSKVNMPSAASELVFRNEYELIVAVILSAQCTDRRVNLITPELFQAFPTVKDLAAAGEDEVFEYIKSVSYPRSKAAHLVGMASKVMADFDGKIPSGHAELQTLPGVGPKTASVVSSVAFGAPYIAVDTHVMRVSHRLGLSSARTPLSTEKELESHIAPHLRPIAHHWLILHGRYVCKARKPLCGTCGMQ